ncbi:MAG: hypothetical protein B6D39_11920 [Anaerolineae bacterium UTCFX2]|nr:protein kinase [Anaerolineales bacterium]OQY88070.1 MAG: hypothetical protein B6D39_11920 [Anaerolineae bacterium UTCFX2]
MAEIICPMCNAKNRGTAQYCSECGTPLLAGLKSQPESGALENRPQTEGQEPEKPSAGKWVLQSRYEIEETLGQGGFGSVYRATDLNLNRTCAIKENLATSAESQRQFMREARVLANLSYPNLPRVTDHFIVPEQGQYLVMDFVEGQDLEKILETREIVPADEALEWMIQVAGALEYLHNQDPPVLHRDIKPANIRITPKGKAMLVDFGLVKVFDEHLKTTVGARAVTPGFAPPEQYGRGGTDARTDIYALGATLYALLTGHEPLESVRRMAGEHMPSAHALNPSIPLKLSDVVERAMEVDPAKRYPNVTELLRKLQAAREALTKQSEAARLMTVVVAPEMDDPSVVKTAAYAPSEAASLPVPPAQTTEESTEFPATTAVAELPLPAPPAAKPASGRRNWLLIGIGGAALAALCLVVAGGGLFALFSGGSKNPVEKTLTARALLVGPVEKTLTARAGSGVSETAPSRETFPSVDRTATSEAELNATQTWSQATKSAQQAEQTQNAATLAVQQTATAKSAASVTRAAVMEELAAFDQKAERKFGPKSGNILHAVDEYIDTVGSGVGLRNFITEVTFVAPYSAEEHGWDFGIIFRFFQANTEFRFYLLSDKRYAITRTIGSPDGEILAEGTIDNLKTDKGDENKVRLYVVEDNGWLFVNDQFITKFDASKHYTGGIKIGVDFITGNVKAGTVTPYKDWTIWSVPVQP